MITQAQFLERAARLSEDEWNYILDLANTEFDCNENRKALSVVNKLTLTVNGIAKRGEQLREANEIATKWVKVLGLGIHPDTRGKDYSPPLSKEQITEYERDIERLCTITDPYEAINEAWTQAGLI